MPGATEAAETGPDRLEFLLLGPLEVRRDGVELELGPPMQRAVLALLLLHENRALSTDRLIDQLWGETPPDSARAALQVYVAGLRKAFGNGNATLRTTERGYVLEVEPGALDRDRFNELRAEARAATDPERRSGLLRQALALWRDTPLTELGAERFATVAAQLEETRLQALEERIEADLAIGRHAEVIPELDALVAEQPYRERLRAHLMLALYRSGRQADALAAYRGAREAFASGLGLEPGPELKALERAVLGQDASLAAPTRRPEAEPEPQPTAARRRVPRVALLVALVTLVGAVAVVRLLSRGDSPTFTASPNTVAVIDTVSNEVVDVIAVGLRPGPIAAGAGALWVGNLEDRTLTRLAVDERAVTGTFALGGRTPTGVAVDRGVVWVAHGLLGQISLVDAQFGNVRRVVDLAEKGPYSPTGSVAVGAGAVWAVFGDGSVVRVEPRSGRRSGSTMSDRDPAGVAVGYGSVWVANAGDSTVQRFNARSYEEGELRSFSVASRPGGIAVGAGDVWVTNTGDDLVSRIDIGGGSVLTIPVDDGPTAVAVSDGAVWVANTADGTVSRIDPETNKVTETIELGSAPAGLVVANGLVWVTVQAP